MIYSRLLRHSTARGSSNKLEPASPTKVKARKSILFTEVTPEVEIRDISLIFVGFPILQHIASTIECIRTPTQSNDEHCFLLNWYQAIRYLKILLKPDLEY